MALAAGAQAMLFHVSYRSQDAVEVDEATGVWTFISGLNRLKVFRMTLVSLEFPLSQRTIEEPFSRFYLSEGFLVGPLGREIVARELVPALNTDVVIDAVLPLAMQYAIVTAIAGNVVTIQSLDDARAVASPHGLFVGPNNTCIVDLWPELAGGEPMRVVLPGTLVALTCATVARISATVFTITLPVAAVFPIVVNGIVLMYAPAIRSPREGAALLEWVMGLYPTVNVYRATFDTPTMITVVEAPGAVEQGTRLTLDPGPSSSLLSWLGWPCVSEVTAAGTPDDSVGWLGEAQLPVTGCWPGSVGRRQLSMPTYPQCIDTHLIDAGRAQISLVGNEFQGFQTERPPALGGGPPNITLRRACNRYARLAIQSNVWAPCGAVKIRPGFYGPVLRSNGPIELLSPEVELQMTRLRLPPPTETQTMAIGAVTIHNLIMESTLGMQLVCPLQMGHYTPDALAQTIQVSVRAAALVAVPGIGWTAFTCLFDDVENRFIMADTDGLTFGMRMDSVFLNFDPRRLGFEPQRYSGSSAYAGWPMVLPRRKSRGPESQADDVPCAALGCPGWPLNWYQMIDGGTTRKFRFVGNSPRTVLVACSLCPAGLLCAGAVPTPPDPAGSMLLQTVINLPVTGGGTVNVPFACPYQTFDIVMLTNLATATINWAVVLEDAGQTGLDGSAFPGRPIKLLKLYAPGIVQADIGCGFTWSVQPAPSYSPLSLSFPPLQSGCTDLRTMPPDIIGFPYGATLWILDADNTLYAPAVMNLEQPDYIVMRLGTTFLRKTDTFQIAGRGGNSVAFAKLVIYPQYQIHGLLPRDLVSANMDSPERFDVSFVNPDGTRYFTNGRGFSFTLAYTSPLGTM